MKPAPAVVAANVPRHARAGREAVQMDVYAHGDHDFVLGPQGQNRTDLPRGEVLLQGALDALEKAVAFVKR